MQKIRIEYLPCYLSGWMGGAGPATNAPFTPAAGGGWLVGAVFCGHRKAEASAAT